VPAEMDYMQERKSTNAGPCLVLIFTYCMLKLDTPPTTLVDIFGGADEGHMLGPDSSVAMGNVFFCLWEAWK
jgi:ABC-type Co2+ transport system permease subunit